MDVRQTRVDIVVVGSMSTSLGAACADYERRIGRYVKLDVHELKAEPTARGERVVLRAEGERFLQVLDRIESRTNERATIVALDPLGDVRTTEQLASQWLSVARLVLLVGGTMGIADEVRKRASSTVSFGRITLPHQLARLVATEQLYRCWRIARNEPYHF